MKAIVVIDNMRTLLTSHPRISLAQRTEPAVRAPHATRPPPVIEGAPLPRHRHPATSPPCSIMIMVNPWAHN
ncbi:hypothetical protein BDN70DRAFT_424167 [Pholiota conissans]|uniref:Uncharacterized protein n=1 Tax=Pholiota conissans TaxID=109636 RepID=A0A9P6CU98_9AGAR|nr:hypothetical protein BDN70DRAFT_424167 [Pholiota conissans]